MQEIIYLNVNSTIKVFVIMTLAFVLSMSLVPFLTMILHKFKFVQRLRKKAIVGEAPIYRKLHRHKEGIPTMAGVLIWGVVLFLAGVIYLLSRYTGLPLFRNLNFLAKKQTWLPMFTLVSAGLLGLFDDLFNIWKKNLERGLKFKWKFVWQILIAGVGAWWFYYKLGFHSLHLPGYGDLAIGWFYIPLFILVILSTTNAVNITDGLDGLAAGVLATCYGAFGALALANGYLELAMFCGAVLGSLLAFLWFNIYPARFFMGDTGALALGAALGVVALLLNSVAVLPIIGFVLVIETASSLIQIISKKIRGKKVFLVAPLHHHLEALGWPEPKIVMRFWIISIVMAVIGVIIGLIGRG